MTSITIQSYSNNENAEEARPSVFDSVKVFLGLGKKQVPQQQTKRPALAPLSNNVVPATTSVYIVPACKHDVKPVLHPSFVCPPASSSSMAYCVDPMIVDSEAPKTIVQPATNHIPVSNLGISAVFPDVPGPDVDDLDSYEDDPIFVREYASEVFSYCREREVVDSAEPFFLQKQTEINEKHREILIDWMAGVFIKFKLLPETYFLSVYIVDKYLSKVPVAKQDLQLLALVAILIGSKFEEIYAVEVGDLIYICDYAYTREKIIKFEREVLNSLNFGLSCPSALLFLRRFSKASHADQISHTYSRFLIELSTMDYSLSQFLPSQIAAAAVYITRRASKQKQHWNASLTFHTKYTEADLLPVARKLLNTIKKYSNAMEYQAITNKYTSEKLFEVAKYPPCADF